MSISKDYLQTAITRMKYYKDLGEKAMANLSDADLNFQPGPESNSIGIIIRHLGGNMLSRWTNFLSEDGEKEWRQRDNEFMEGPYTKAQLTECWEKGWICFFDTMSSLRKKDLKKTVYIRQEALTVVDAINRQLAHYPYHVGQMIYIARMIKRSQWISLSIPKGASGEFNRSAEAKDPAKKYS